ncbi:MAG TPA: cyclic nucleotide-binding domain-containing protein [Fimbriimonadaceae bacterium]|nr:cyclic nucleotide-binding domain-containing protein [Fimbriimonadaceae bacterium]
MSVALDLSVFKQNYLVSGLSDEQVGQIAALATVETFLAGETVTRIGEDNADLYVILDGRVNVLTADGDKLGEAGPGSVLGEIGLIDARPRTANTVTVGLTRAARLPARELRSLMNGNRDLGFVVLANLARVLCGRLRMANARLDELIDKTTDAWEHAY